MKCSQATALSGAARACARQGICKHEAAERPCPRIVLVCCAALAAGGLSAEGLFQKDAPDDLVHFLLGAFEEASGVALPPPGLPFPPPL